MMDNDPLIRCFYCHLWDHAIQHCQQKKQVDHLWRQFLIASTATVPCLNASTALVYLTVPQLLQMLQGSRCLSSSLAYVAASTQATSHAGTLGPSWIIDSNANFIWHLMLMFLLLTHLFSPLQIFIVDGAPLHMTFHDSLTPTSYPSSHFFVPSILHVQNFS